MILASGFEVPTDCVAEICSRYGVQELSIFGSAARGDMRPDSDVDVLVEFLPGVVHGWEYFRLEMELAAVVQLQARDDYASYGSPLVIAGSLAVGVGVVVAVGGLLLLVE